MMKGLAVILPEPLAGQTVYLHVILRAGRNAIRLAIRVIAIQNIAVHDIAIHDIAIPTSAALQTYVILTVVPVIATLAVFHTKTWLLSQH